MRKTLAFLVLLLSSFYLSNVYTNVHAENLPEDLVEKKENYEEQIEDLQKQYEKKQTTELAKQVNEKGAVLRAYRKALAAAEQPEKAVMYLQAPSNGAMPPSQYIEIYKAAGDRYGVDWTILAAIHKTETQFSSIKSMVSSAGAIGHMQFMPATWASYGVDADGDGKADPYSLKDAIFSAAKYLAATGAANNDVKGALWSYNHSDAYGQQVMGLAATYKNAGATLAAVGSPSAVSDVGKQWIGRSTYVFGGGRKQSDISAGIFDCSSFVHWAYKQTGVELGALTGVTTDTLKHKGKQVSLANARAGDLVFFDTYKKDGHVAIYRGNGTFIGAQGGKGVQIADMTTGYWKQKFNGRVIRIGS